MLLSTRVVNRLLGYRSTREFCAPKGQSLVLTHDSGFFSNCSALLLSLAHAETHPLQVDASVSFSYFRDEGSHFDWTRYFRPAPEPIIGNPASWNASRVARRLPHHSIYRLIDFQTTNELVHNYFSLSPQVESRAEEIANSKLPVPMEKILVLCVRGTDKGTEVKQSPLLSYIRKTKQIMKTDSSLKVWIQTDQLQIRDLLLSQLGPRSFSIDVLPVTDESTVIHRSRHVTSRNDFARDLLATTWLMSRAHSIVSYTGNVGYWIALFRGSARRLYQLR